MTDLIMTVVASGMAMSMVYYTRYTIYMIIIIMTCNVYNISAIPRIFGWGPACGGRGGESVQSSPTMKHSQSHVNTCLPTIGGLGLEGPRGFNLHLPEVLNRS